MILKSDSEKTWIENAEGEELAFLEHPRLSRYVVNIAHVHVDESLMGRGVSGKMMMAAVEKFRRTGVQVELGCPYAIKWFADHPEYDDVVVDAGI